jgi:hypothetical protein
VNTRATLRDAAHVGGWTVVTDEPRFGISASTRGAEVSIKER